MSIVASIRKENNQTPVSLIVIRIIHMMIITMIKGNLKIIRLLPFLPGHDRPLLHLVCVGRRLLLRRLLEIACLYVSALSWSGTRPFPHLRVHSLSFGFALSLLPFSFFPSFILLSSVSPSFLPLSLSSSFLSLCIFPAFLLFPFLFSSHFFPWCFVFHKKVFLLPSG